MPRDNRDGRTVVGVVRKSFSALSTERGGAFTPALFDELARLRAERPGQAAVGVVAAWHDEEGERQHAVRVVFHQDDAVDPVAISIGRHSCCDVPFVPGAALRHALLLLWPTGPGEVPRMEAVDLATGIGLAVGEARPATRIEGMGAVRFGVGSAEVLVLPASAGAALVPAGARALIDELVTHGPPVRSFLEEAARARVPIVETSRVVWARPREQSSIVDGLSALRHAPTSVFQLKSPLQPRPVDGRIHVLVSAADVADGILLGRYPRCRGHTELARTDGVSRVHAFVFSRGGRTFVADAGSTNGTKVINALGGVSSSLDAAGRVGRLEDGNRLKLAGIEVVLLVEGMTPNMPSGGVA